MATKRALGDVSINSTGDDVPAAKQPRKSYAARVDSLARGTRRTDALSMPAGIVPCPHPGCSRTMKQGLLEQHIGICPMNPLHRRLEANKQAAERNARRSLGNALQRRKQQEQQLQGVATPGRKSVSARKSTRKSVRQVMKSISPKPEVIKTPCLSDDDEPEWARVHPDPVMTTTIAPPNLGPGLFNFSPGGGFDLGIGASPPPVDLPEFPDKPMVAKVVQATPPPPPPRTLEEARFEFKLEKQRKRQDQIRREEAKSTEACPSDHPSFCCWHAFDCRKKHS
eukprot:Hpha_TRINITY_DN467_c0_g1::TRINITY_DN467_c0_g1_i1::g.27592::m.27592